MSDPASSPVGRKLPVLGKLPGRVQAIINPAAGQDQPILKLLNVVFQKHGIDWDVSITKVLGDGQRLTEEAVRAGVDLVLVNGGDGTVMECASGLIGTGIPLLILPGGTANVMAHELGMPFDLKEAITLAVNPYSVIRPVDMGKVGDSKFLLRTGMGLEAAMVEGADRELKDRVGLLAYGISALQALADPPIARYQLTLDGVVEEREGLACIVANSGHLGTGGLLLSPKIDISDGLLDVLVITRSDLPSLVSLIASVVAGGPETPVLQHWQVHEVLVDADPVQSVQVDGEMIARTPISIQVLPQAVQLLVPPQRTVPDLDGSPN